MHYRVTDECSWSHEFDAHTPAQLERGIRAAWDAYSEGRIPPHWEEASAHPALRHHVRCAAIGRWLDERLARDHTPGQESAWRGQAAKWRADSARDYGASALASPLVLHVQAAGEWIHPNSATIVRVARNTRNCAALLALAERAVLHAENIARLISRAGEILVENTPRHLRVVQD